jgi:hypothetical protein
MLAIMGDPDLASDENSLGDLKMLGEGFQRLAEAEIKSAPKPPAPPAVAAAPVNTARPPAAPPVRSATEVFTAADKDVTAPVEIARQMPPWIPPTGVERRIEYQGLLEVVINEQGLVSSAVLRNPVSSSYDAALIAATKSWRYRPAMKDGEPVKYRKTIAVSLTPSGKAGR